MTTEKKKPPLVAVMLTDRQRITLALFIRRIAGHIRDAEGLVRSLSFARHVFSNPRSSRALAASLMPIGGVDAARTTTVKFDRLAAKWWGETAIEIGSSWAETAPPEVLFELLTAGAALVGAVGSKRGKRPRKRDENVLRLFDDMKNSPRRRRGADPYVAAASQLRCDVETVRRAVKRALRATPRSAAKELLSE